MNNPVCFRARNIGVIRQVPTVVIHRNKMGTSKENVRGWIGGLPMDPSVIGW
jgi:hypothetical protein